VEYDLSCQSVKSTLTHTHTHTHTAKIHTLFDGHHGDAGFLLKGCIYIMEIASIAVALL